MGGALEAGDGGRVPGTEQAAPVPDAGELTDDHVLTPRDAELERLERELERFED